MAIKAVKKEAEPDQPQLVQMSRAQMLNMLLDINIEEQSKTGEFEAQKAICNALASTIKTIQEKRRKLLTDIAAGQQVLSIVNVTELPAEELTDEDEEESLDDILSDEDDEYIAELDEEPDAIETPGDEVAE
jgi:hypothetical protein